MNVLTVWLLVLLSDIEYGEKSTHDCAFILVVFLFVF